MSVTLGYLRTFCREVASPDSSGVSSEREFIVWINSALQRLWADADWAGIERSREMLVPAEASGTASATNGSNSISLASGTWPSDVEGNLTTGDGPYELILEGDTSTTFRLVSDSNGLSTGVLSRPYLGTTGNTTYYLFKNKLGFFGTPETTDKLLAHRDIRKVTLVWDPRVRAEVPVLLPAEFDRERLLNPTEHSAQIRMATLRNGRLEIWPHPGSAQVLHVSYLSGAPYVLTSDADTTVIDWPTDARVGMAVGTSSGEVAGSTWTDLLLKAILLEAALHQGEDAPVPYRLAKLEYLDRLTKYKSLDTQNVDRSGSVGRLPLLGLGPSERSFSDFRSITDVGPAV